MVKINGSSFALQYKRTTGRPIDSTETFKTLEDATSYARNTDAEEYFPYAGQIISVEIGEGVYKLVKDDTISEEDGRKHYRLSPIITEEESGNKYLSKIEDDEARGLITFLAGINVKIKAVIQKLIAEDATFSKEISSKDYVQNLLGWLITPEGHIDAKSLRLRDFLEVPELRYNRVSIVSGEEWNAPGGGIIESVDAANKTVHLKLEPGEVSQVEVDDICKGVFNNDTGFQTAYFRITEKIDNSSFKYVLRSGYTFNPCKAMHFVAYGNFTNAERQKSCYSTQNYIRFLKGVNNWEITKDMIAMQLGDLSNLKLFGIDMSGHSAYLNRVYMTGTIRQISSDGVTEAPIPVFKGKWKSDTYWYYDEVTHNGSTWICIESTTTQEPSDSSTDWLKSISKGDTGSQGAPGKDGIPGKDGADGKTSYFHIKYSPVQNPTASQMTDTPNKYIGTYVDFVQASSSDPSKYTWAKFEGGDGIPGTNGENGKTSYLHIKYSDDGKTFTANNGETPGVYMGVYVDFVQADSNVFADYTWSKIKGEAGKDGKGVQSVDVLYYLSSSSTSLSGGSWSTNSPTWVDGKYIWSKTKVVYTDGSSIETNPACITGGKGSTGDNGRGVSSIVEEYYLSTSSNSLVGGSWSTTPPTWENGKYIWTRSVITYTDSASTTTDPICVTGGKGATGIGVKSVSEQYYLSTSYSTTTGGSWSTTVPAWKDGKYIWTRSIITYTDNSYTETNPVCVTGGKGPSGNDGVGISAVDVLYYLSTSSSSLVGGSWSSTSPTWQNGKYLWSKTKVTYTDNSTWESDPVCITGSQGKTGLPGKDGADGKTSYFHIKYSPVQNPTASQMTDTPNKYIGTYVDFVQASSSDPSKYTWAKFEGGDGIPGTNGENGKTSYLHIKYSDDGKTFTANNGETPGVYMGVYVDFVQADSNVFADYTWSKIKGEAGKDGKGVQSVDVLYYLSSSSTSLSGGSWSTNSPTWVDGKYIWSKTKVVYTDGSSIETNPACITGGKGSTGDNGRGVSSIVEEYYLSTSSNSLVGGSWSTTPPTWENGKYIWTRSVITYTDSASTTTDPICVTGGKGATGIGVKSVSEQYYLSTSYSTTTGGSWSTTVPAWKDGKYIWTRSIITYTDNSYTETNPVCVTGGKGPSGNDGVGISAVDVLYYLSTSSSSLVGGSWSSTSPTWQNGKYLWSKTKVTYTDNSTWESDPVCITGSQGKTGLPGAMLRPRGVWAANTEYYHNDAFIDTVIYNGQNKLCKITHTSTSSFDSTKWEEFSEFVNVATNVLLAQNATIDVLGTSGIFVGNLEKTEGWLMTEGSIKHNQTGVELTADGKISLPESGGMTVGGKTFIEAGKIKTEFINVDTLEVTKLKGATGTFKELQAIDNAGKMQGKISFNTEGSGDNVSSSFNIDFSKTWISGDLYQQGYNSEEGRSWRFYTSDLWCRGEFGHRVMTTIKVFANNDWNFYVHIYGYGSDNNVDRYPQSGQPIDCIVMEGNGNYVLRICDSATFKKVTVVNSSDYPKRVVYNQPSSLTYTIEPWKFVTFVTADIAKTSPPYYVNNLFIK